MCVQSMDRVCSEYGLCAFRVWIVCVQSIDHVCSEHGSCVFRAWIMCSEHGSCVFRAWIMCVQSMDHVCSEYGSCVFRVWIVCVQRTWFVCDQSRGITPRQTTKCFEAVSVQCACMVRNWSSRKVRLPCCQKVRIPAGCVEWLSEVVSIVVSTHTSSATVSSLEVSGMYLNL